MNGQVRRGMNRKRSSHQILQIWQRKWRKYCAAALCVTLGMGSLAGAFPVQAKNDTYDFDLDRVDLYEALQKAVTEGDIVDTDLAFQGANADEYDALLEAGGDLYELKPEMKKSENDLKLRVFARLEGDIDLENAYEINGDESFIFLLVNGTDTEQRAVIHVDQLTTGEITIAPASRVAADDGSLSAPSAGGAVSHGGSGGSGGGSSTGAAADETAVEGTEAGAETSASEETGAESTEQNGAGEDAAPEESGAVSEDTAENQPETDQDTADGADSDSQAPDQGDSTSGSDSSEAAGDSNQENGGAENGTPEGDSTVEIEDDSQDEAQGSDASDNGDTSNSADSSDSGDTSDSADSSDSGDTADSADTSDSGDTADSADSSDSGDAADSADSDEGTPVAGISLHAFHLLAATPSEAERIDSVVTVPATPSEASPSEADKNLIPGMLHDAAVLNGKTAVAFETTAGDLELDDEALALLATPSEARRVYKASTDDVTVRVYADPEAFDEEVTLEVTKLSPDDPETADAYQEAMDKLEENGAVQDTMLLHDVTFYNEAGEEVEPAVPVSVTMEFLPGAFPEDADPATLSIHHMAEAEGNVTVENVADAADATDGKAEMLEDGKAVAEFSVDSFSVMASGVSARAGESTYTYDQGRNTQLPTPGQNAKSTVNFYVNLDSVIANSTEDGTGNIDKENFSGSVATNTLLDHPRIDGNSAGGRHTDAQFYVTIDGGGGYVVLQSTNATSAKDVNNTIRDKLGGEGYKGANVDDSAISGFRVKVPTDTEVFEKLLNNWDELVKDYTADRNDPYYNQKRLKVGNTYILKNPNDFQIANGARDADEFLNTRYYEIRWYVFKYNSSDAWHVDGILVPISGELEVKKTFIFDPVSVDPEEISNSGFYMDVSSSDTGILDKVGYKLALTENTEDDPNSTLIGTVDASKADQGEITYTWQVIVYKGTYTLKEHNFENLLGVWTLTRRSYEGKDSEGKSISGDFSKDINPEIKCVTTFIEDEGAAEQYLHVENHYEKKVQNLVIHKKVEGLKDLSEIAEKDFAFTIKAADGTKPLDNAAIYKVEGGTSDTAPVSGNELQVTGTVSQSADSAEDVVKITIENLPIGTYEVKEVADDDLDLEHYYWSEVKSDEQNVILTKDETGNVTITNVYKPWLSVTVKKVVTGNLSDKNDKFSFSYQKADGKVTTLGDLKDQDEKKVANLKEGDTITILEMDSQGYEAGASAKDSNGTAVHGKGNKTDKGFNYTIKLNDTDTTITFTNTKEIKSPTGVITNVLPYAAMLAIGALGVTGFTLKGRRKDDND